MFETTTRITRRRSSAGPIPLQRPQQPRPRPRETSGLREGGYVPFGPFLAGAGFTAMFFGPQAILRAVGL
jgi:hypothetical protein